MTVHRESRLHPTARSHRPMLHRGAAGQIGPRHRRASARSPFARAVAQDRGDVPGWVLITLMTAALVVAIWAVASDQLVAIFESALAPFSDGQP
ncbi:hypothetical protein Bequi_11095 [Brachybacterium sp. JHP9]|uniref:Uncharacterized protein n=1 Tax=Brachybacterium equifaecis TaxID=2910770 RepID=A0ABT0R1W0_9MICO|nr:hypothetical protein [Brachybacterium equifaecis]MCL6423916.1 hypothetical protein [Brachybacterium equifaecis]